MTATPSGPPSGPPQGPSGPPSGPGGPPAGPSGGTTPSPGGGGTGASLNRNQLIGLVVVVCLVIGGVIGAVAAGGGGDDGGDGARKKHREEVLLEPISATSDAPFTSPIAPADLDETTVSTIAPPPGQGPFGGTGDNTLCDREQLIAFLTDPANSAQAREWARIVGITVTEIPDYVRDLIPTTLTRDARVTNHTFERGRAVPIQSVLQAGTAVLVDTYGTLVARCRCGNPLLEPKKFADPVYVGPKWPGFDPTVIVIVVPSSTEVYPPGGVAEPTQWTLTVGASADNVRGSTDSVTEIGFTSTLTIAGNTISGTGEGRVDFNGGCYNLDTGAKLADQHTSATFTVRISGTASGDPPNRTYALTFTPTFTVEDPGVAQCPASTSADFAAGTTEVFESITLPARDGVTEWERGEYFGGYTLCAESGGIANVRLTGRGC